MKKYLFVFCSILIFSACASGQATPSGSKGKDAAPIYQSAFLLKVTAVGHTQTDETRHTTLLDSTIVEEKIVTYEFTVRSGTVQYTSQYTSRPGNPLGKLPQPWWDGNALVGIRIKKHTLYIKLPEGGEVASHIVSQKTSTT
jgi:hypothetical protein